MSKFGITVIGIVIITVVGLWLHGWETPRQTDNQYLKEYRLLHATKMSDEQILNERKEAELNKAKWKYSNELLKQEMTKQGKEQLYKDWTIQKQIYQVQFFSEYYEHNITADAFVRKIKKD